MSESVDQKAVQQQQIAATYQTSTSSRRQQGDGVVVTPVEVVDFINRAVQDVLATEFGTSLADGNVHILDPFTGTGIFPARMMQTAHLTPEEKASLATRIEAWELDPEAADTARTNLAAVIYAETGQSITPRVHAVDTFTVLA